MSVEDFLGILWRRRWLVLLTVIVATAATYAVARSLDEVYEAESTLVVSATGAQGSDFEASESARVLVRTFAELIQSDNVAQRISDDADLGLEPDELLERMSFRPVEDTRLLVVSAEGGSPAAAAELANDYAEGFAEFATDELTAEAQGTVGIADEAIAPIEPVRPKPALYAGVMFVLSLFFGAGLAVARDRLEKRLGSDQELGEDLGMPVFARVPVVAVSEADPLRPSAEPAFLEGFRVLLANLGFLEPGVRPRSVLLTSPMPGEGKTTCCVGLANVVAEQGHKVTLIEADLRRPTLSAEDDGHAGGLVRILTDAIPFEDAIEKTSVPNLFVLPAGVTTTNPSSLFRADRLARLIDEVTAWSDFVIVDSPPVAVGPDAALLAREVDGTLLVLSSRRTVRERAVTAAEQLRRSGTQMLGVILNEVPDPHIDYVSYGVEATSRRRSLLPGRSRRRESSPS